MLAEIIVGGIFLSQIAPIALPEETALVKEAARLTRKQMTMTARTSTNRRVKAYFKQDLARRNRVDLQIGETIYFPNGMQIAVEEGLKDVQVDGWWYAWSAVSPNEKSLPILEAKE